jgi:hypothetical protein
VDRVRASSSSSSKVWDADRLHVRIARRSWAEKALQGCTPSVTHRQTTDNVNIGGCLGVGCPSLLVWLNEDYVWVSFGNVMKAVLSKYL